MRFSICLLGASLLHAQVSIGQGVTLLGGGPAVPGFTTSTSPLVGLTLSGTNPQSPSATTTDHQIFRFGCTGALPFTTNPVFSNENCVEINQTIPNGQNDWTGAAKKTFLPLSITGPSSTGAGQRFGLGITQNALYGSGDAFMLSMNAQMWGGQTDAGGEGFGIWSIDNMGQGQSLATATITSVSHSGCPSSFTAAAAITKSATAQSVQVSSSSGCSVNDWVTIDRGQIYNMSAEMETVQITAVPDSTHITAVFTANHLINAPFSIATVLGVSTTSRFGEKRLLVDETVTPYTTGTVASISGQPAVYTGNGTLWTSSMVGGDSNLAGCVELTADAYTGSPFSSGAGTLNTWYPIQSVGGNASATISHRGAAGQAAYSGKGPGSGGYSINLCDMVMRVVGSQVILAGPFTAWTNGDTVENALSADGYMTSTWNVNWWTPGAALLETVLIRNNGARTFSDAIRITSNMPSGGGADTVAWNKGIDIGSTNSGVIIEEAQTGNSFVAIATTTTTASNIPCFAFQGHNFGGGFSSPNQAGMCANGTAQSVSLNSNNQAQITLGGSANTVTLGSGTTLAIPGIPSSAGSGGLYVCVDNTGATYKKASCP